jgi:hypothetical protein
MLITIIAEKRNTENSKIQKPYNQLITRRNLVNSYRTLNNLLVL